MKVADDGTPLVSWKANHILSLCYPESDTRAFLVNQLFFHTGVILAVTDVHCTP